MAINNGLVYIVTAEGFKYAGQTSASADLVADMIEVTTKDSTGAYKEFIYGEKTGTISVEGLNDWADSDSVSRPLGQWINNTQVTVLFGYESGGKQLSCEALISNVSITGAKNEAAGYSATLQITGAVTEQSV